MVPLTPEIVCFEPFLSLAARCALPLNDCAVLKLMPKYGDDGTSVCQDRETERSKRGGCSQSHAFQQRPLECISGAPAAHALPHICKVQDPQVLRHSPLAKQQCCRVDICRCSFVCILNRLFTANPIPFTNNVILLPAFVHNIQQCLHASPREYRESVVLQDWEIP